VKIKIHSTVTDKTYNVSYHIKEEGRNIASDQQIRDTFVRDLFHFNNDLSEVIMCMNARDLNIVVFDIQNYKEEEDKWHTNEEVWIG